MSESLEALGAPSVEFALVTFAPSDDLDAYRERRRSAFPILCDPERLTYSAYGLERASTLKVWGPANLRRYVQILRPSGPGRGLSDLAAATGDTRQLGGDFVIDAQGRLVWAHWSTGPADRPAADTIVAAVRAAQRPPTTSDDTEMSEPT